jgi:tRNA pseudouridine55 synthase
MDGKPLYEYARKGIPLPRPIEPRNVVVHALELVEWKGQDHTYKWPEESLSVDEKAAMETALKSIQTDVSLKDEAETPNGGENPAAFVLKMKVTGGTYVRSIVHDLAHHMNSAGHVVALTRSRQGQFVVGEPLEEGDVACVPWDVFQKAQENLGEVDEDGWAEWDREVLNRLEVIEK